jgi:ribonucleoside-triphosphate reductase
MDRDGETYLRMRRATYLVGLLGLNELVQAHTGRQMHEGEHALKFGLKVVAYLYQKLRQLSEQHGVRFVMEQTPAESAAYRLARLDIEHHPVDTEKVVKGDIKGGGVYYTNSTYLNVGVPVDPIERVQTEGKFHDLIEAGALTHVWLADARPPKESIAQFVLKTFRNTRNAQIAFSPEFVSCNTCFRTARGLLDKCPYCGSTSVDHITRVTGYFSRVSGWNKGKKAELRDRFKKGVL